MPDESVGSAYATIGIKIDEAGLNAAQGKISGAVRGIESGIEGDFSAGLRKATSGSMKDVGKSVGTDLSNAVAGSMGPLGNTIASGLSVIGPAGIVAAAGIAGVGLAISSSVAVAGQFQQTMSGVAAVAGATAPQLELMATAARDAGASSVFSASQAAEAMGFLASSGMSVQDTIATLEPTLMMAAAGGLGLAEAGDLMAGSLAQFGLAATDATMVADTLAAGAAASNASVTQLGQGLQNVGPMAASVGMSLQETTAALGVFANSNIKGAEAGTALKSMIASLLGPTKTAAAAFAEMGISADQVNPSLHSYDEIMSTLKDSHMTAQQAVAIFGKEMAANALVAVNGADSYDELLTKVSETGKASEMAATSTDNYKGAMDELGGAVEEAQITLGTAFLPVLTDTTQALTAGVRASLDFASGIGDAWDSITSGDASSDISTMLSGDLYKGMEGLLGFHNEDYVSAGNEIGDKVGEGVAGSDDLAAAPGEALGSDAALAGAGAAGAAVAEEFSKEWVEAFQKAQGSRDISKILARVGNEALTGGASDYRSWNGKTYGVAGDLSTEIEMSTKSAKIKVFDKNGGLIGEEDIFGTGETSWMPAIGRIIDRAGGDISKSDIALLARQFDLAAQLDIKADTNISIADVIFGPEDAIKSKAEELGSAAASALKDGIVTQAERMEYLGLAQDLDLLKQKFPEVFAKIGEDSGQALMDALKREDFAGALAIIGKEAGEAAGDEAAKAFYGKLADGSGRFFGDFQTQAQTWQTYVNGEGGFVGPTEYYDDYYAAQAGQQIRAMEALQNVEDIKVALSVDVETAKQQLQAFYDGQKKEEGKSELEKTLEINDDKAKTDIAAIDTAAKLGVIKPFALDGVDYAMGQIASIDAAASAPVTKMIYLQTVGGASGGSYNDMGIPAFANEGYVRSPTLAVIGDRPGGEYVVGADRFEAAAAKMGSRNDTRGGDVNIYVTVQGSVTGEDLIDQIVEQSKKAVAYDMARGKKW